ncbi:hypothetical protein GCM10009715_09190 [Paeniglutamicibacter psychrophenolicus]
MLLARGDAVDGIVPLDRAELDFCSAGAAAGGIASTRQIGFSRDSAGTGWSAALR